MSIDQPQDKSIDRHGITGYRVGAILGTGGFGTVLAATRHSDDYPVAIKIVHSSDAVSRQRLDVEAEALRKIGPPHVPALYDAGVSKGGYPYLVLERLEIPTLGRVLGQPMAPAQVAAYLRPIFAAVQASHAHGIVHRDLKPENIFIQLSPPRAVLIDFGLAKAAGPTSAPVSITNPAHGSLTATGATVGTATYMAPEQCDGRRDIGIATDIYALGVIVYEMLAGHPPFRGESIALHLAHMHHRPPSLRRLIAASPALDTVVQRCLAKDSGRRFSSVGELGEALWPVLSQSHSAGAGAGVAEYTVPHGPEHLTEPPANALAAGTSNTFAAGSPAVPKATPNPATSPTSATAPPVASGTGTRTAPGETIPQTAANAVSEPGSSPASGPVSGPISGAISGQRQRPRTTVGLAAFASSISPVKVRRELAQLGGILTLASRGRYLAAFCGNPQTSPVAHALAAAQALIQHKIATGVKVDHDKAHVFEGRGGNKRVVPSKRPTHQSLSDVEHFRGTLLTRQALDTLTDIADTDVEQVQPPHGESAAANSTEGVYFRLREQSQLQSNEVLPPRVALVGRDDILADLVNDAARCRRSNQPAMFTVHAEPGFGKSLLAATLAETLAKRFAAEPMPALTRWQNRPNRPNTHSDGSDSGNDSDHSGSDNGNGNGNDNDNDNDAAPQPTQGRVIALRPRHSVGVRDNQTLEQLLSTCLRTDFRAGQAGRDALCRHLGEQAGNELWPALALVCGVHTTEVVELSRLRAAPSALRAAAARAAGEVLLRSAAQGPIYCIIDDVHLAGDILLDALEYACRAENRVPLWVCVLGRPDFAQQRAYWGYRSARCKSLNLDALAPEHGETLCRQLLYPARDIPARVIDTLLSKTRGNPLLISEIIRGIRRHGLIRRHDRSDAWFLAADEIDNMPELSSLSWLATRRIRELPDSLLAHAQLLAILDDAFTTTEVEGILDEIETEGIGHLFLLDAEVGNQQLCESALLTATSDGAFEFQHAMMREHLAAMLDEDTRIRLHRAAYRYYYAAESASRLRRLSILAYHAAHSHLACVAVSLYIQLGDLTLERHDYVDAGRWYTHALNNIANTDHTRHMDSDSEEGLRARMRALHGRGLAHYRLSRFDDTLADLHASKVLATRLADAETLTKVLLDEATALDWMYDFNASSQCVEESQEVAPTDNPLINARILLGLGRNHYRDKEYHRAVEALEEAAKQAAALGNPGYETHVIALLILGHIYANEGQVARADKTFADCITLCRKHGDSLHLASAFNNRSDMWMASKQAQKAEEDLMAANHIARIIGQMTTELVVARNLTLLYYYIGDTAAARQPVKRALALEPLTADPPHTPLFDARLSVLDGDMSHARTALENVDRAEDRARANEEESGLLDPGSRVLYQMIDLAIRQAPAEKWQRLRQSGIELLEPVDRIDFLDVMALSMYRRGDVQLARALYLEAEKACAQWPHVIESRVQKHAQMCRVSDHSAQ